MTDEQYKLSDDESVARVRPNTVRALRCTRRRVGSLSSIVTNFIRVDSTDPAGSAPPSTVATLSAWQVSTPATPPMR